MAAAIDPILAWKETEPRRHLSGAATTPSPQFHECEKGIELLIVAPQRRRSLPAAFESGSVVVCLLCQGGGGSPTGELDGRLLLHALARGGIWDKRGAREEKMIEVRERSDRLAIPNFFKELLTGPPRICHVGLNHFGLSQLGFLSGFSS